MLKGSCREVTNQTLRFKRFLGAITTITNLDTHWLFGTNCELQQTLNNVLVTFVNTIYIQSLKKIKKSKFRNLRNANKPENNYDSTRSICTITDWFSASRRSKDSVVQFSICAQIKRPILVAHRRYRSSKLHWPNFFFIFIWKMLLLETNCSWSCWRVDRYVGMVWRVAWRRTKQVAKERRLLWTVYSVGKVFSNIVYILSARSHSYSLLYRLDIYQKHAEQLIEVFFPYLRLVFFCSLSIDWFDWSPFFFETIIT